MVYQAIATDYDGTLATDGRVEPSTLAALRRWRDQGGKLILITGRQLQDLLQVFPEIAVFDWVVAENGALLYHPQSQQEKPQGEPPPEEFIKTLHDRILQSRPTDSNDISDDLTRLQSQFYPLYLGRVVVATWEPHSKEAIALIQEMGLDLQVILNKGAVMILPAGIDKASGLRTVAQELRLTPEEIVGVGDAENDLAFLEICGYAAAVANALPGVTVVADWVARGDRGEGVVELIEMLLAQRG
jgi:HAD superfamily hydrolase (TIGR01484 family)